MRRNRSNRMWTCPRVVPGAILVMLAPLIAAACNVPVFRVALERWKTDAYRVTIVRAGPETESDRTAVADLRARLAAASINAAVDVGESADMPPVAGAPEADASNATGTRIQIRYPAHLRIDQPLWDGPSDAAAIDAILDSPARRELVGRLAGGQTAVYLLVDGKAGEENDAIAEKVEGRLKKLEQELKLPELTDSAEDEVRSATPLRIAFSMIRIGREDPAEQGLLAMLLRIEHDLLDRSEPILFPVFGRGRALLPLVGPGISDDNVRDAAAFLVGPCSCEIKELNPGFDLLLAADWDRLVHDGASPPSLSAIDPSAPAELVQVPAGQGANDARDAGAPKAEWDSRSARVESPDGAVAQVNLLVASGSESPPRARFALSAGAVLLVGGLLLAGFLWGRCRTAG